jgi:hypothetical protein
MKPKEKSVMWFAGVPTEPDVKKLQEGKQP